MSQLVTSVADAVRAVDANSDICLLITDYHLTGKESDTMVIESVRAVLGPQLNVILMTGDTSLVIQQLASDDRVRIASKPVHADELLGLIDLLGGSAAR